MIVDSYNNLIKRYFCVTIKHVVKTTCIKQPTLLKGHYFRSHLKKKNANLPVLGKYMSLATPFLAFP